MILISYDLDENRPRDDMKCERNVNLMMKGKEAPQDEEGDIHESAKLSEIQNSWMDKIDLI